MLFLASLAAFLTTCAFLSLRNGPNLGRDSLLMACGCVFGLRTAFMLLYLLPRQLGWLEAIGDSLVVWLILYLLLVFWGDKNTPLGPLDAFAVILFIAGSALTTGAELARKRWKKREGNLGHLYTGGAFRFAQHINYFGEVVSFSGFAVLTRNWWAVIVPIFMLVSFVFVHIPALDRHLREHYSSEFVEYQRTTKKLVPFVY
jgi:steroid 5-alpha reductase family enzyme